MLIGILWKSLGVTENISALKALWSCKVKKSVEFCLT